VVLAQHQIDYTAHGVALINAFVMAKVMLVAEDLNIGRRFEEKALAVAVRYKSIVFAAVFIGFRAVEDVVIGVLKGKTFWESVPGFGGRWSDGNTGRSTLLISFSLIRFSHSERSAERSARPSCAPSSLTAVPQHQYCGLIYARCLICPGRRRSSSARTELYHLPTGLLLPRSLGPDRPH
jgi:hypothetical protein